MGGYYARAQGEDPQVADAIRDHYKPVGQGDDVPTAPVTVAVSLADKLDTLGGFWSVHEKPTGSKDPFALRRAVNGSIRIIIENEIRLGLMPILDMSCRLAADSQSELKASNKEKAILDAESHEAIVNPGLALQRFVPKKFGTHSRSFEYEAVELLDFFADRLKVQQREAGVRHDLIDAVFALGGEDDLVRLLARVKALQAFVGTEDGVNLLAGYKRATRVIPAQAGIHEHAASESGANPSTGVTMDSRLRGNDEEAVEAALREALELAEPLAATAIEAEDFASAMTALASLRAPIDAFFEGVMVNDPDPDKRAYRLGLLARFRDAVHRVADFSKIEG
jgi:glycyl-tRNA synthetase beta chain